MPMVLTAIEEVVEPYLLGGFKDVWRGGFLGVLTFGEHTCSQACMKQAGERVGIAGHEESKLAR